MNITEQTAEELRKIDLSTEQAITEHYKGLCTAAILTPVTFHSNIAAIRTAIAANGKTDEAFYFPVQQQLQEYALMDRAKVRAQSLSRIKQRIAILFAEWEEANELEGYIVDEAVSSGFNPKGKNLSDTDKEAIDKIAGKIYETFERYLFYSLSTEDEVLYKAYKNRLTADEAKAKLQKLKKEEYARLFCDEWEDINGRTTSFENEVTFFGGEFSLFFADLYTTLGANSEFGIILRNELTKNATKPSKDEAKALQRAQKSRYKELLND